jgi:transposase InsO family protein
VTSLPIAHVGSLPIEETLGSFGPALLVAIGVARAQLHARMRGMHSRAPRACRRATTRRAMQVAPPESTRDGGHRRVYGSPRIHAELVLGDGERLGRRRVERLMRKDGISGLQERRRGRTTIRVPSVRVRDGLVDRAFAASGPNRLWVADITYLRTWEGWLYLAAVRQVFSRRIVGWAMADHMRSVLASTRLRWPSRSAVRRPD